MKSLIVLCIVAIGLSSGLILFGTTVAWANAHSAPPAMVAEFWIMAFVGMGSFGWVVMTPFRWRTRPLELGGLAAMVAGQLCAWVLGLHYDLLRAWATGPLILAAIALLSISLALGIFLIRPLLERSRTAADPTPVDP